MTLSMIAIGTAGLTMGMSRADGMGGGEEGAGGVRGSGEVAQLGLAFH